MNNVCVFLILWGWFIIFLCHNKWQRIIFFNVISVNLRNSLGDIFLRKKSIYVKIPQQGRLLMKWDLCVSVCVPWHRYRSAVPEAEEVEAFVMFLPSPSRHQPAAWGWGQAARRLGYSYIQFLLWPSTPSEKRTEYLGAATKPFGWWGEGRTQPGLLADSPRRDTGLTGSTQHLFHRVWGICVINLLWPVGEDFLGSYSTEGD